MKKLVVFTGAGMSAESGIPTFRGAGGLWEGYRVEDVASPEAWEKDQPLVLDFYNQRRKNIIVAQPNEGHEVLARLEKYFEVVVITQNIDDLHERAGSSRVLHLHGEIMKARSTADANLVYPMDGWEIKVGDLCEKGSQLRPHIVWFGEMVPMMEVAVKEAETADMLVVVGTSLQVYPAAGLVHFVPADAAKYIIDPTAPLAHSLQHVTFIEKGASEGLAELENKLI